MVVYGSIVGASVAALFAAGILPGLLMAAFMMIANHIISSRRGYQAHGGGFSWARFRDALRDGLLAMIMPLIIVGGILGGVFTPTEAAAVAVGYALLVGGLVFRTLNFKVLAKALRKTVYTTGVSLLLVAMGGILSWVLASERVPVLFADFIMSISNSKTVFMLLTCVLLLIVGCFMDLTAAIIILAPILTPVATRLGINPIHFGVVLVMGLNIGLVTPPVGAVLFITCSVARERLENIVREIWPFLVCMVATL